MQHDTEINDCEEHIIQRLSNSVPNAREIFIEAKKHNNFPYAAFGYKKPLKLQVKKRDSVHTLSTIEEEICDWIGCERTTAARKAKKKNMRKDAAWKERFLEKNGVSAEYLYGRIFNLYPYETFRILPRSAAEDNGDYKHDNLVVDVKVTEYTTGCLTVADWKRTDLVNLYCLFTGRDNSFTLRGFCPSKVIIQKDRLGYLPGRRNLQYIVKQKDLTEYRIATTEIAGKSLLKSK